MNAAKKRRKTSPILASRSNGAATIKLTERSDSRFRVRWVDSAQRSGESTHRSREDAEAAFEQTWERISAGFSGAHATGSFGALGEAAMARDHLKWQNYSWRAWNDLNQLFVNHITPKLGHLSATQVTKKHIEELFTDLQRNGYRQATFSKVRKVLGHIATEGVRKGIWTTSTSPMFELERSVSKALAGGGSVEFELEKTPTPDEVESFVDAAFEVDERFGFICAIAAYCGLRYSEAASLKPEDFDWDSNMLFVRGTKTKAALRRVPIGATVLEKVKSLVDETTPGAYITATINGNPYPRAHATKKERVARRVSGMPDHRGSLHYLRHFYAWQLLSKGAPLPSVSKVLGHASPATTLSIYAHAESVTAARDIANFVE